MIKEDDHNEVKTDDDNPATDTDKKDVPSAMKEMEESKAEGCKDENKDATLAKSDIKVPDTKDEEDNHIADQ